MPSTKNQFPQGSVWRKWDLHVHTPLSISQNYGGDKEFDKFVSVLETLPRDVKVLGINDYYFIDGYERVIREKLKNNRLKNIEKVFPVLEFRIDTFGSGNENLLQKINLHILFNIDESNFENEIKAIKDEFLTQITISNGKGEKNLGQGKNAFVELSPNNNLQDGFQALIPSTVCVLGELSKPKWKDKVFLFLGFTEWNNLNKNNQIKSVKEELAKKVDAFFTAGADKYVEKQTIINKFVVDMPLLHSQDIHDFSTLNNHNCKTWIKSDPTFEGLKQIVYESDERVKLQEDNPEFEYQKPYFSSIQVDQEFKIYEDIAEPLKFSVIDIPLNKNLVTIIGGRGEGKSTLINYLANIHSEFDKNSDEEKYNYNLNGDFKFKYHKLNNLNLQDEDILEIAGDKKVSNSLGFIFIRQGELKEFSNQDKLSDELKQLLNLTNPNFSRDLQEQIDHTNVQIEEINEWLSKKDENGNLVNSINYQEHIKNSNIELLKNLKNSENKDKIDRFNENLKEISSIKKHIFAIESILKATESYIKGVSDITDEIEDDFHIKIFKPDKYYEYLNSLILTQKSIINQKELNNEQIKKDLSESGISGDLTSLLENTTKYQGLIDEAEKKLLIINKKQKDLEEYLNTRKSFGKKIKQDYHYQAKSINSKWQEFTNHEDEKKQEVLEILLNDDKIKISGEIDFNLTNFFEELENCLAKGSPLVEKVKKSISDLNSWVLFIETQFQSIFEGISFSHTEIRKKFTKLFFDLEIRSTYLTTKAEISYDGKSISKLSAGQKGTAYLRIKLAHSAFDKPIIFDQPEDDLDNKFIMEELVDIFKKLKRYRQIIIVTHNANLVVNADAEQVIIARNQNEILTYESGSLENSSIRSKVCEILEGGETAFKKRENKYNIN